MNSLKDPILPLSGFSQLGSRIAALLNRTEVDQAVIFVLLNRGWQILTMPATLFLIAKHFSPEVQGFYYTFVSVLALQSFLELGFVIVIINVSSHEWAHLRLDEAGNIVGRQEALSRLASL